jgi:predicted amidohydrolase
MKVLAFQPNISPSVTLEQKNRNVKRMAERLDEILDHCGGDRPDLVVLPELCTIDYSRNAFERLDELSEPLTGYSSKTFAKIAGKHGCHICYGFPRRAEDQFRICSAIVGNNGLVISYYDKLHMAQFGASLEKQYFSRGEGICVFKLAGFTVGVIICYDFRFGEYIRSLVDVHGVNLILHPVAFTTDETFASWHHFVVTRALENQVFYLSLNRAGETWGDSIFCPPWIDGVFNPEVFGKNEEYRLFSLRLEDVHRSREVYTFSGDRLDNYESLKLNRAEA